MLHNIVPEPNEDIAMATKLLEYSCNIVEIF